MSPMSEKEIVRQFRVIDQTLSMHTILKRRYEILSLVLDVTLLACAVIFCATTFARDDLFTSIGLSPRRIHFVLGLASLAAFFASLFGLRADWKGKSAQHKDATQKLTRTLALFRELRADDGTWPRDRWKDLHQAYWEAMNNIVEVPSSKFASLKAKHLRKLQLSKMLDSAPGSPVIVLRLALLFKSVKEVLIRKTAASQKEPENGENSENTMPARQGRADLHEDQGDRDQ